jgi:RHS repeat-associated protein
LKQTKHQLNSGTEVVLADNTYDELGRLKTTQAAEKPNLKQTYGYNIRSWTSSISGQLYSEKLYYNEQFGQGTKYYNGNIATIRQGLPDLYIGYNYFYDAFSQLTEARTFWTGNGSNTPQYYNTYDTHYEYDKNGNMFRLTRIDDLNIEDLLIYYNGNQRTSITDWPTLYPSEYPDYYAVFTDYSNGAYVNFSYNLNGALKHDPYKRVEYQYNYLNLPNEITVPAIMGKIKYQYTADGRKLKATYEWCSSYSLNPIENTGKSSTCASLSMKTTDYVGNMIYENGNLKRILTDNGYIENNIYHFYLKDHLGNNAVVANTTGYSQQFNFYFPYGLTSGTESWNLGKQPYKFGGKEYETMHGLNLYDFVARPYDPAAGQFLTPDPMAEKYPWISPYAYCGNNPVNYIDPDGRDWVHRTVEGVEEVYYDRTVTSQEDVNKKYGEKSGVTHMADGSTLTQYNKDGSVKSQFTFTNDAKDNKYGTVTDMDGNVMDNSQITYGSNYTIFGTSDDSVNAETLHQNFFGTSYTGPNNPLTYGNESLGIAPQDSYQYLPRNLSEAASMRHDQAYDSQNAHGIAGALFNTNVIGADMELTKRNIENANRSYAPTKDRARSAATAVGFGAISAWKLLLLLPRL